MKDEKFTDYFTSPSTQWKRTSTSSDRRSLIKKGVLRNFAKFTGKQVSALKRKIHYPFIWIQLIELSSYLNMNSCLHLSNKLKECGKFLWMRLWNHCFISMKEFIFSKVAGCKACNLTKLNSFISIFKSFAKSVSYLVLRFSKLRTTFIKNYVLPSGLTTSLQCHKTSIQRRGIV